MLGRAEIERGVKRRSRAWVKRVVSSILEFSKITHRVESDPVFLNRALNS
jgi:hypothetical protein